jgi:hypothetical protein
VIEPLDERSEVLATLSLLEELDAAPPTAGEGTVLVPPELVRAAAELARLAVLENAEWNHLHEGEGSPEDARLRGYADADLDELEALAGNAEAEGTTDAENEGAPSTWPLS